jgi:hypothetical protein
MNRIAAAIETMRRQIQDRIAAGLITSEKVEQTRRSLDMEPGEHVRFHELKSLAFTEGLLTFDEAHLLYRLLGGTPDVFNTHDAATKAVLTSVFGEMLQHQIAASH